MPMSRRPVPIPTIARKSTSAGTERASPGSHATAPKNTRKIGTSRAPNTSANRPATSIAGSAASATQSSARPSCASVAPVARWMAGRHAAHEPGLGARTRPIGVVVADNERAFRRNLADELVELHPDQACFSPKLDAVTFDLSRHARRHLGALKDDEHVVQHDGVLELERRQ